MRFYILNINLEEFRKHTCASNLPIRAPTQAPGFWVPMFQEDYSKNDLFKKYFNIKCKEIGRFGIYFESRINFVNILIFF